MTDTGGRWTARARTARRLLIAGIVCIFGGEALCIFGPLRDESIVHVVCHAVFYTGVVFAGVPAALHWTTGRCRKRSLTRADRQFFGG